MSVFHGKQGKGAMRAHRADKTREANDRDLRAPRWSGKASPLGRKAREGELDALRYVTRRDENGFIVFVARKVGA